MGLGLTCVLYLHFWQLKISEGTVRKNQDECPLSLTTMF